MFGGPAWTRITGPTATGQWYLHLFDAEQPDLNWDNPEVFEDLEKTLRFWLDRGVDGFRIDVAHGMAKPPGLPDMTNPDIEMLTLDDDDPRFNHEGVHEIHRGIRSVLDDYPHAVSIGEIWVFDNEDFAKYLRPDELHMGFNFRLVRAEFDAVEHPRAPSRTRWRRPRSRTRVLPGRCPTTTSTARSPDTAAAPGAGPGPGHGDGDAGAAGAVFLYNGRNSACPTSTYPTRCCRTRSGTLRAHRARPRRLPGADAVGGRAPPFGFSANPDTWLPMPAEWASLTVERQQADPDSTLAFFRTILQLRRSAFHFTEYDVEWLQLQDDHGVPVRWRAVRGEHREHRAAPAGRRIAHRRAPLVAGELAPDSAAWIAPIALGDIAVPIRRQR